MVTNQQSIHYANNTPSELIEIYDITEKCLYIWAGKYKGSPSELTHCKSIHATEMFQHSAAAAISKSSNKTSSMDGSSAALYSSFDI